MVRLRKYQQECKTAFRAGYTGGQHNLGRFTYYRCGDCGLWLHCPRCMAIRTSAHDCMPEGE